MTTWCPNCRGWVDENHVVVHSDRSRKPPDPPDEKIGMDEARRMLDAMEKTGMARIADLLRQVLQDQENMIEQVRSLATAQQQSASRSTRDLADSVLSALVGEP